MSDRASQAELLILFDLDGTLVDGQHSIYATFSAIFPQFGYEAPRREAVRAIIGRSLPKAIGDLLGDDAPIMPMVEAYKEYFMRMRQAPDYTEALYDDADRIIRTLSANPRLALGTATGKALRGIHWLVERNSWEGLFDTYQAADTAASKPAPEMVLNACAATGIPPARTLVIGDSTYDMEMARDAGAYAIGVTWGYGEAPDLIRSGAQVIINKFNELETIIERRLMSMVHA
jgi:phosphoglycolate phosphatase